MNTGHVPSWVIDNCPTHILTAEHLLDAAAHQNVCSCLRPLGAFPAAEEFMARTLQEQWDEHCGNFATDVPRWCSGRENEPTIPAGQLTHLAGDVFGDLEDCYADEESGPNYSYGALMTVTTIANALRLKINATFPPPEDDVELRS